MIIILQYKTAQVVYVGVCVDNLVCNMICMSVGISELIAQLLYIHKAIILG